MSKASSKKSPSKKPSSAKPTTAQKAAPQKSPLDDTQYMASIDAGNMAHAIADLPNQIEQCWKEISSFKLPASYKKIKNVIIVGMGGSGIGNDLAAEGLPDQKLLPITTLRDYDVPDYVNSDTLLISVSYSGGTEEVLSATEKAHKKGAKVFCICSGGKLKAWAQKKEVPTFQFSYKAMPRAALGYLFTAVLWTLYETGALRNDGENKKEPLAEAIESLRDLIPHLEPACPTEDNNAKYIAYLCYDRLPLILGSGILSSVAKRFKTQFNENAKSFAFWDTFPELNHNTAEGIIHPEHIREDMCVLLLENSFDHPQTQKRIDIFKKLLEKDDIIYESIEAPGDDIWTQKLCTILLGDYITYYLAILNKVDPTPVTTIEWTKKQL